MADLMRATLSFTAPVTRSSGDGCDRSGLSVLGCVGLHPWDRRTFLLLEAKELLIEVAGVTTGLVGITSRCRWPSALPRLGFGETGRETNPGNRKLGKREAPSRQIQCVQAWTWESSCFHVPTRFQHLHPDRGQLLLLPSGGGHRYFVNCLAVNCIDRLRT